MLPLPSRASGFRPEVDVPMRRATLRGPNGSVSVTSVDDASKQSRSGLTIDSVQLLIREPLTVVPKARAVRVDGNRDRAGTAHVRGPQVAEVIGLAQEVANVSDGNLVNGDRRTTESGSVRSWWREQRIRGQVIGGTIAGLIVLAVAVGYHSDRHRSQVSPTRLLSGEVRFALGDPLVDSYSAFVAGRCRLTRMLISVPYIRPAWSLSSDSTARLESTGR